MICLFVCLLFIHTLQLGFAEKLSLFVDFKISFRMIWLNRPSFVFDGHRHTLTEWKWLRYNFDDSPSFKAKGWFYITMSGLCGAEQIYSPMCTHCGADGIAAFSSETVNKTVPKIIYAKVWLHTKGSLLRSESVYMTKVCAKLSKNTNICGSLVCFLVTHQNEMKWSDCVHSFLSHPSSFSRQKC